MTIREALQALCDALNEEEGFEPCKHCQKAGGCHVMVPTHYGRIERALEQAEEVLTREA